MRNFYEHEHESIELSDMSDEDKYHAHLQVERDEMNEMRDRGIERWEEVIDEY